MSKKIVAHITESEVREDKEGSEISNVIYGEDHVEGKSFKEVKEKLLERGIKFPRRYVEESGIYQDDKKGQSHRTGFIIRGKDKYQDTGKTFDKETVVTFSEHSIKPIDLDKLASSHASAKKLRSMS